MPETISTAFDPTSLPAWAQRDPQVVEACRVNLAYRADVCSLADACWRRLLRRQAREIVRARQQQSQE
jgi:hypothetical protein